MWRHCNVATTRSGLGFAEEELAVAVSHGPANSQRRTISRDVLPSKLPRLTPSQPTPRGEHHTGLKARGHLGRQFHHFGGYEDFDVAFAVGLHRRADPARVGVEYFVLNGGRADCVQQRVAVGVAGRLVRPELCMPLPNLGGRDGDEFRVAERGQYQPLQHRLVKQARPWSQVALLEPFLGVGTQSDAVGVRRRPRSQGQSCCALPRATLRRRSLWHRSDATCGVGLIPAGGARSD
jgi:hypothetical protein